jgi:3D (Asp-Asp-Asp) domain-containing protein
MSSDDRNRAPSRKAAENRIASGRTNSGCFGTVRPVLGRKESRPVLVLAACGALVVAALPSGAGAGAGTSASVLRGQQRSLAARSRAAVLGLYSLDTRLTRARAELASLRARAEAVERERARAAHELAVAHQVLVRSQAQLGARLRSRYERGEPDTIAVVLGAQSLQDAVSQLDALDRTARLDRQALADSKSAGKRLRSLAARLAGRAAELRDLEATAARTAASLEAARGARIRYIGELRREQRLKATQIARVEATARSGARRSEAIEATQAATVAPATPATPTPAGGTLTVTATGYSLAGTTSTGLPVGWGVVAVDPAVIPLGTHLSIPGYGEGVAADTGGAVQGATIDLWFPTPAQALEWGRRVVTITLH